MAELTIAYMPDQKETLGGMLAASLLLHIMLFVGSFAYMMLGLHFGAGWGKNWGAGGAIRVNAVASLPGVPLPTPRIATPNTLATQNPGLYLSEPTTKLEPPPNAVPIPKFKEAVALEKPIRVNKRIQHETTPPPENAIPYGLGGKPSMNYSQFVNAGGEGGLNFGVGDFGERFGWYVDTVRNRISNNWLLSTISPGTLTAPRVYVHFDISRDGTVSNVEITQSSGVPEVDRSALRAVLASNPLAPLPPAYSENKVSVKFYFDFRRR
jgi:TonB family protein